MAFPDGRYSWLKVLFLVPEEGVGGDGVTVRDLENP